MTREKIYGIIKPQNEQDVLQLKAVLHTRGESLSPPPNLYPLWGDGNQQGCVGFAVDKTVNIFFIFFLPVNTGDFRGSPLHSCQVSTRNLPFIVYGVYYKLNIYHKVLLKLNKI